jgi:hypothetical protein
MMINSILQHGTPSVNPFSKKLIDGFRKISLIALLRSGHTATAST